MYNIAYVKPESLEEAIEQKSKYGKEALFIAGGSNILVYLKDRKINPKCFIDISEIKEFKEIKKNGDTISIGPAITISEIENSPVIEENAYLLYQAALEFANPLIKNKATIGGNIADASPAADMAPPLLALNAYLIIKSIDGGRELPIEDFFISPRQTAIKANEIITEISFNRMGENETGSFIKLGNRNATTISVVSIATLVSKERNKIKDIRIALGSVAPKPIRCHETENILRDKIIDENTINYAMEKLQNEVNPISDIRASADYRREMSAILFKRALYNCMRGENNEL